jgi:polygalacturonase
VFEHRIGMSPSEIGLPADRIEVTALHQQENSTSLFGTSVATSMVSRSCPEPTQGASLAWSPTADHAVMLAARSGEANIRDWGAIGDGQTDDTDAFEAAMQHIVSSPAGARAA